MTKIKHFLMRFIERKKKLEANNSFRIRRLNSLFKAQIKLQKF